MHVRKYKYVMVNGRRKREPVVCKARPYKWILLRTDKGFLTSDILLKALCAGVPALTEDMLCYDPDAFTYDDFCYHPDFTCAIRFRTKKQAIEFRKYGESVAEYKDDPVHRFMFKRDAWNDSKRLFDDLPWCSYADITVDMK